MNTSLLLALGLTLFNGEPSVKLENTNEYLAEQALQLSLDIQWVEQPENPTLPARVFNKYDLSQTYPVEIKATPNGQHGYAIHIDALAPGDYRLVLDIPYEHDLWGIPMGSAEKTIHHDFKVHAALPDTCFNFNKEEDGLQNWQASQVYVEAGDQPIGPETCPGLFFIYNDWPLPLSHRAQQGSLFVPVSSECFPKTSSQNSEQQYWTFTLQSPSLQQRAWQQISGIEFRIATKSIPIQVVPEIRYRQADEQKSTLTQTETPTRFAIPGGHWQVFQHPVNIEPNSNIEQIIFHFYGIPEQTVGEEVESIFIDGVCPKR